MTEHFEEVSIPAYTSRSERYDWPAIFVRLEKARQANRAVFFKNGQFTKNRQNFTGNIAHRLPKMAPGMNLHTQSDRKNDGFIVWLTKKVEVEDQTEGSR